MNREDELALSRIKSNMFAEILDAEKSRLKEYNSGIIHNTACFAQIPPWKKQTPRERWIKIEEEYNS